MNGTKIKTSRNDPDDYFEKAHANHWFHIGYLVYNNTLWLRIFKKTGKPTASHTCCVIILYSIDLIYLQCKLIIKSFEFSFPGIFRSWIFIRSTSQNEMFIACYLNVLNKKAFIQTKIRTYHYFMIVIVRSLWDWN